MQRITITIDDDLADEIDKLAEARGYQNKSETVRDLVRAGITQTRQELPAAECVATMTYVFDQGTRELPKRLAHALQEQHDLIVATMRVALDHDNCLEVAVLKGKAADVERLAQQIIAERGVRHGRVNIIPAEIEREHHTHGHRHTQPHQHIRIR